MAGLLELLALATLVISISHTARMYRTLPEKVPIHFGFSGRPDNWGPRWSIWLLPVIAALMLAVFWLIPAEALPARMSLPFALLKLEQQALLLYLVWAQIEVAVGRAERLGPAIWLFVTALVATSCLLGR